MTRVRTLKVNSNSPRGHPPQVLPKVSTDSGITIPRVMRREGRLGLASKMGADSILAKPFSAEELIETVNGCLGL